MTEISIPIDLDYARERITATYKKAIESLIGVGHMLKQVKDNLGNDTTFHAFVETLPFSQRSAYYYLKLDEHYQTLGSAMVALNQISISVWYQLDPDSELVDKVIERAKQGKKVSKKDLKQMVASIEYETVAQAMAWNEAVETSPNFVLESFKRGVVTDLDGNDIPVTEADPTLLEVLSDEDKYERTKRQKLLIADNANDDWQEYNTVIGAIDNYLSSRLGFKYGSQVRLFVKDKQVKIYIQEAAA